MRSPVSRVAAALMFVLTIAGVAFWFHGGGTAPAFADFLQPILEAKTARYKMSTERTALSPEMKFLSAETQKDLMKATTAKVMKLDSNRSRTEWEKLGKSKTVYIWDGSQGKGLWLYPAEKRATVSNITNMPKEKTPNGGDPVANYRSLLLDARDKPNTKRESLGETVIDGRRVIGFRIGGPTAVISIWGDPKTGLPVRVETTRTIMPNMKITMSDFEFNVDMDESLFSLEPPAGYEVEVQDHTPAPSPPAENDLMEMFRNYSKWTGGRFPDLLDMEWLHHVVRMEEWCAANITHSPSAKRAQDLAEAQHKLERGLTFTILLPKEADSHYAGRGVSLGAADTPVFWYRPKDAEKYRVIYADLSVRDADTPPRMCVVPVAQLEKDLIDMFRQYSELSGGPFPESLDMATLSKIVILRKFPFNHLEQLYKSSEKQKQEKTEAQVKLLQGLMFTCLLPPEADSHYAGKGISLGAADTPIFWYCPKDAKKYRVIYADLSVREVETRPSVPDAQSVPAQPSPRQ